MGNHLGRQVLILPVEHHIAVIVSFQRQLVRRWNRRTSNCQRTESSGLRTVDLDEDLVIGAVVERLSQMQSTVVAGQAEIQRGIQRQILNGHQVTQTGVLWMTGRRPDDLRVGSTAGGIPDRHLLGRSVEIRTSCDHSEQVRIVPIAETERSANDDPEEVQLTGIQVADSQGSVFGEMAGSALEQFLQRSVI